MPVNHTPLIEAIETRRLVRFDYFPGSRLVEPHALGYSADRAILLRAFQRSGSSASGNSTGWKIFSLLEMWNIMISEEKFTTPRPGYRRGDRAMRGGITAQL